MRTIQYLKDLEINREKESQKLWRELSEAKRQLQDNCNHVWEYCGKEDCYSCGKCGAKKYE